MEMNFGNRMMFLLSFISCSIAGYTSSYVISERNIALSSEATEYYNNIISYENVLWSTLAEVDVNLLLTADTIRVPLDDETIEFIRETHTNTNEYYHTRYTSFSGQEYAEVSILDDNIQGYIRTLSGRYYIASVSADVLAIVRYEKTVIEEPDNMMMDTGNNNEIEEQYGLESVVPGSTPVIRVLFLYTYSTLAMFGSQQVTLRSIVYTFLENAKNSFINSGVNAHLELAYLGSTDYDETSHSWTQCLNHFYSQNDGYLDEVHTLRNKYSADICVLMINKNVGLCGEAATIKANASQAFCVIYPSPLGCNYRYSAIHEIGHLVGCRHNMAIDGSTTPYQYGHGYMHCVNGSSQTSWCTIMSYESSCSTDCDRVLYWSNPYVTYNGSATGTTAYEHNARVWNERGGVVSAFRSKSNGISLTSSSNNTLSIFESYEAITNIESYAGYEVQANQTVDLAAGTEIRMKPDTHIKYGSNFRASIRNNADDSYYPQFVGKRNNDMSMESNVSFYITPNPVNDILTIISDKELSEISIYNMNGQCVLQTKELSINVVHLPSGIYMVRAMTDEGQLLQSKFIKR